MKPGNLSGGYSTGLNCNTMMNCVKGFLQIDEHYAIN